MRILAGIRLACAGLTADMPASKLTRAWRQREGGTVSSTVHVHRLLLLGASSGADSLTEGGTLPERERRFLGCIRLSLAALYQAEVVDGTFKVNGPRS